MFYTHTESVFIIIQLFTTKELMIGQAKARGNSTGGLQWSSHANLSSNRIYGEKTNWTTKYLAPNDDSPRIVGIQALHFYLVKRMIRGR